MVQLYNSEDKIDIVSVSDVLNINQKLELVGGRAFINDLSYKTITTTNVEYYAKIVQEKEIKRSERRNASENVENHVEKPLEFFVDDFFSFEAIAKKVSKFQGYLELFPISVVTKAEQTFKKKRKNQWANMQHILDWLEKENTFYKRSTEEK